MDADQAVYTPGGCEPLMIYLIVVGLILVKIPITTAFAFASGALAIGWVLACRPC